MESITPKLKRAFPILCACIAALSFIQFLLFYIPNEFFYENTALLYAASHITTFFEALFSPIAAMIIFLARGTGIKNKILPCSFVSILRFFYSVPYYYIYYVSDVFNSIEAISLAIFVSFVFVLFFFLQTFVCILIMNYTKKGANKQKDNKKAASPFDLDDHINFGIVLSVIFIFVVFFIRECINTVQYLTENSGSYRTEEIITIVLSYLIIFAFSFVNYLIIISIKNKLI